MAPSHYEVLDVPKGASFVDIRAARKKLSLVYHPDKNSQKSETEHSACEAKTKAINHAFEVLSDPAKRQAYDILLAPRLPVAVWRSQSPNSPFYSSQDPFAQPDYSYMGPPRPEEDDDDLEDEYASSRPQWPGMGPEDMLGEKREQKERARREARADIDEDERQQDSSYSSTSGAHTPEKQDENQSREQRSPRLKLDVADWGVEICVSKGYRVVGQYSDKTPRTSYGVSLTVGIRIERDLPELKRKRFENQKEEKPEGTVTIHVINTPGNRQVGNIQSLFKHRAGAPNPLIDLTITLVAPAKSTSATTPLSFCFCPELPSYTRHIPTTDRYTATHMMFSQNEPPASLKKRNIGRAPPRTAPEHRFSLDTDLKGCGFLDIKDDYYKLIDTGTDSAGHAVGCKWWRLVAVGIWAPETKSMFDGIRRKMRQSGETPIENWQV